MTDASTDTSDERDRDADRGASGCGGRSVGIALVVLVAAIGVAVALVDVRGDDRNDASGRSRDVSDDGSPSAARVSAVRDVFVAKPGATVETIGEVDLGGTWAFRSVQTSIADVPVAGEVEATTTTLKVVELRQKGAELDWRSETCDSRVESAFDRIRTVIPDAFVESAPVTERGGQLLERDGRVRIRVPEVCGVRGADVDDPSRAELPSNSGDPRVVDGDGDGHPGVTIRVEGTVSGRMYLVQRGCDAYSGRVITSDRIRGTVEWSTEQVLLDATSMFLSAADARPHEKDAKHWFEMRRIEDSASCEGVADRFD